MTDLVTFGETMLRLSPPRGERLSRADSLDVHVGGAESNVAVAASNLGLEAAWLSRLPLTDLGERVAYALRGEGVDPVVTWAETGRVGTYYYEPGERPRPATVVYDREGSAIRSATPENFEWQRIRTADAFFTSGITPALSDQMVETTRALLTTAADAGVRTVFDVNYRAKLWDVPEARRTLEDLFPAVDVLFVAGRDAREVLGYDGTAEDIGVQLRADHDFATVVVTRGAEGAVAVREETYRQPAFSTETVDPVGSGDAFVGGYLANRLRGGSVGSALEYGAAAAALKRTVEGDVLQASPEDVAAVVDGGETAAGDDGGDTEIQR